MTDEDQSRRRRAKLFNERLKLMASFCNTVGVATFVTLILAPVAGDRALSVERIGVALLFVAMLHGAGQMWLLLWRSED